jgi:riboflavin synthase
MFTGLVEAVGSLESFIATDVGRRFRLLAPDIAADLTLGESLAVNGCCLTVVGTADGTVEFDLLAETLECTNLGALKPGSRLNLERALAANARLGGHFVQGHVDATARLLAIQSKGSDLGLTFELPAEFARYVIPKGSIALNGVSLTIAELADDRLTVWIIPHTSGHTNLGDLRAGDPVNVEYDVLAKYAARQLQPPT